MSRRGWILSLVLAGAGSPCCHGQPAAVRPFKGIVWSPPASFAETRADMERIAAHGANAARVPLILDPNVNVVADLFGVTLFQEVDASFMSAARYAERMGDLATAIDSAIEATSQVEALPRFGLGYWIDTSVPATCATVRELSNRVHRRLPGALTYYVSAFIESDVCSHEVDFVLLDAKGTNAGEDLLRRWRAHSDTPVGISGVGFPVRAHSGYGYLSKYTPEHQARMLENNLTQLLADSRLEAVFVNRWRADRGWSEATADEIGDYGIIAPDGSQRPSAQVVWGLFTGQQKIFAFDAGEPSRDDFSWVNLISFLSFALFGLTYYGSIGLRTIVRRYFLSHAIYLEKLGDGREATIGTSLFLLLCLSLAASVVGMTVLTDMSGTRLWYPILHWLPEWIARSLRFGVARSGLLVPLFASMFSLVTLLWAALLSISTRGENHLRFGQALLTAVMPRWPVALIGLFALVMLNWRIDAPGVVLIAVMAVWFAVVLLYTGRMFSDFLRLIGFRVLWTVPVLLLALLLLAGAVWLIVVTNDLQPELDYLWNIASGT